MPSDFRVPERSPLPLTLLLPLVAAILAIIGAAMSHMTGGPSRPGDLNAVRVQHSATLLPNGHVLIAGGVTDSRPERSLASAELYDPATGAFTATGSLISPRGGHTAIRLDSGEVLIVGGFGADTDPDIAQAELYNPDAGTFRQAGANPGQVACDSCAPATRKFDGAFAFRGPAPGWIFTPTSDFSFPGMRATDPKH